MFTPLSGGFLLKKMTKRSIVRIVSVYGSSFTCSPKNMMFGPINSIRSSLFAMVIHTSADTKNANDELLLHQILSPNDSASKFISKNDCKCLMEKYLRAGNVSGAYSLLQSLHERNIILPNAWENLLVATGEKNEIKLSCRIFRQLLLSGKPLSSDCYLNLARAFMNTDDCTHLLCLLKEVLQSSTVNRLTIMNRIFLALSESRQIDKVLQLLDQMKDWEIKPDLITYNTVLDILGRAGIVNEMLRLFSLVKQDGLVPDIITYNTLLNGFKKSGRFDLCLVFYNEMRQNGIEPDLLTYTAMIDSFGRSGNTEESLRLFDEMKQRQIRPSLYIYRALIDSMKKSGNLEKAMHLTDEMNSSSVDLAYPEDFKRNRKTFRR